MSVSVRRYCVAQNADLLDLGFHDVADPQELGRLTREANAFGRAREHDVTWLEHDARRQLFDDARDAEHHEPRIRILLGDAVHAQGDMQAVRVAELVGSHDPWAERTVRIEALALEPLAP